jgi:Pyruvate/2-oxoacid:ferredoxin oxidoreductase delta subunit
VELAMTAKESGADAIVATNTYGPVFDFTIDSNGKPHAALGVEGAKGGLSGDALFHIALTDVADISREVQIPVIASGGVMSAERAIKMLYAGASLVEVYTYLHDRGVEAPSALTKLTTEVATYMRKHRIASVQGAQGSALPLLDQSTELTPQIPIVDHDLCTGCDRCIPLCLPNAITLAAPAITSTHDHSVAINDSCVGCGICVVNCPVNGALSMPVPATS